MDWRDIFATDKALSSGERTARIQDDDTWRYGDTDLSRTRYAGNYSLPPRRGYIPPAVATKASGTTIIYSPLTLDASIIPPLCGATITGSWGSPFVETFDGLSITCQSSPPPLC